VETFKAAAGCFSFFTEFIDAGMGCNNPMRYLVEEAGNEFDPKRMVSCIVSIGKESQRWLVLKPRASFITGFAVVHFLLSIALNIRVEQVANSHQRVLRFCAWKVTQ
jgi:hypothetical protein